MEADAEAPFLGSGLPSGHEAEHVDATEGKRPLGPRVPRGPQMATVCPPPGPRASVPALSSPWWKQENLAFHTASSFLTQVLLAPREMGNSVGSQVSVWGQAARVVPDTEQTLGKHQFQ